MTAVEVGTATLHRPAPRVPLRRRLPTWGSERSLPSTAMFAGAAVLLATDVLPVVDGELVADIVIGSQLARLLSTGKPPTKAMTDRLVEVLLAGLRVAPARS